MVSLGLRGYTVTLFENCLICIAVTRNFFAMLLRICAHDVRLAVVPVAVASGGMLREFMIIILILIIVIITFSYQIKCFYNFL